MSNHVYKPIEYHIEPWETKPDNTICHTHRLAWREADRLRSPELKRLIAIAYDQGVRMDKKLRWYNKIFGKVVEIAKEELSKRDTEQ